MFEQWNQTVSAVQQFLTQHMPQNVASQAGWGAIGALAGGVALCVLGAKLARFGMTLAWAAAGAAVGYKVAVVAGLPPVAGMLLFAAGIGAIGHLTYRIWVGVLTAGVITAIVLGAFGYHRVGPRFAEYNTFHPGIGLAATDGQASGNATDGEFSVPTALEQASYRQGQLRQEFGEFWGFVKSQDLTVAAHTQALTATALVFGLLIGLSTIRLTLILSTSLIGTLLVTTGVIGAINAIFPGFAAGAAQRPLVNAAAMAVCLLISIILQVRLTRSAKEGEVAPESPKAKRA